MGQQLYSNCRIITPIDPGHPLAGAEQGQISDRKDAAMLVEDGIIRKIGDAGLRAEGAEVVDLGGRTIIPGFVDPHTHCCFARLRESEFVLRIAGTPYLEILKKGGGILSSVQAVEAATEEHLAAVTLEHITRALHLGTTTIEIKSGYGLTTGEEMKMLRAIATAVGQTPQDVVVTFLGAHAVPPAWKGRSGEYIEMLIADSLPQVKEHGLARYCDIFCEEGVFSIAEGRRLLTAAKEMGFGVKIHADEVHDLGGAALAAEVGAISADHLLAAGDDGLAAMAEAGCVANLLPATAYSLRKEYARARAMIEKKLPVALATDCNPGSCYTESMQFIYGLAVLNMMMTPEEALVGVTLNPAYSLGVADRVGSIEEGKQADFLVIKGETPAIFAYHAGVSSVDEVYKKGVLVEEQKCKKS